MNDISQAQFEAACRADDAWGPLVVAVRYRRLGGKVEVSYENGVTLAVPVSLVQELREAGNVPQAALADVMVWGGGRSIFFPRLGVSVWAPGLLRGVFGTKAWMQALARGMGAMTSPAKAAAARENGKKGGRPRKVALGKAAPGRVAP